MSSRHLLAPYLTAWPRFALWQGLALAQHGTFLWLLAGARDDVARLEAGDQAPIGPDAPAPGSPEVVRAKAERGVIVGVLWLVGGLMVTAFSYSAAAASPTGGRYMVAYGAIIYGAVRIIRGLAAPR